MKCFETDKLSTYAKVQRSKRNFIIAQTILALYTNVSNSQFSIRITTSTAISVLTKAKTKFTFDIVFWNKV